MSHFQNTQFKELDVTRHGVTELGSKPVCRGESYHACPTVTPRSHFFDDVSRPTLPLLAPFVTWPFAHLCSHLTLWTTAPEKVGGHAYYLGSLGRAALWWILTHYRRLATFPPNVCLSEQKITAFCFKFCIFREQLLQLCWCHKNYLCMLKIHHNHLWVGLLSRPH